MGDYLAVLLPSIGVGLIFWFVMRSVMRADRGERQAEKVARQDAEEWYERVRAREGHDLTEQRSSPAREGVADRTDGRPRKSSESDDASGANSTS